MKRMMVVTMQCWKFQVLFPSLCMFVSAASRRRQIYICATFTSVSAPKVPRYTNYAILHKLHYTNYATLLTSIRSAKRQYRRYRRMMEIFRIERNLGKFSMGKFLIY